MPISEELIRQALTNWQTLKVS